MVWYSTNPVAVAIAPSLLLCAYSQRTNTHSRPVRLLNPNPFLYVPRRRGYNCLSRGTASRGLGTQDSPITNKKQTRKPTPGPRRLCPCAMAMVGAKPTTGRGDRSALALRGECQHTDMGHNLKQRSRGGVWRSCPAPRPAPTTLWTLIALQLATQLRCSS